MILHVECTLNFVQSDWIQHLSLQREREELWLQWQWTMRSGIATWSSFLQFVGNLQLSIMIQLISIITLRTDPSAVCLRLAHRKERRERDKRASDFSHLVRAIYPYHPIRRRQVTYLWYDTNTLNDDAIWVLMMDWWIDERNMIDDRQTKGWINTIDTNRICDKRWCVHIDSSRIIYDGSKEYDGSKVMHW